MWRGRSSSCSASTGVDEDTVERLRGLLRMYDGAIKQLRIPTIDRELYEVCFVRPVRRFVSGSLSEPPSCFVAFKTLCQLLEEHCAATVRVLHMCHQRDALVAQILKCCGKYERTDLACIPPSALDFVLRALEHHKRLTLPLVEAIFAWREHLTRPFPFHVSGENYLQRILADCAVIDASRVGVALQLQLTAHPLGGGHLRRLGAPRRGTTGARGLALRRAWGEALVQEEPLLQAELLRDLSRLAQDGRFVPLLDAPALLRHADAGVPLEGGRNGADWLDCVRPTRAEAPKADPVPSALSSSSSSLDRAAALVRGAKASRSHAMSSLSSSFSSSSSTLSSTYRSRRNAASTERV